VFFTLAVGALVGFTVLNNEKSAENEQILIEEFVPVTVKENTVNTSTVSFIDRGTMKASWYGPQFHGSILQTERYMTRWRSPQLINP